MRVPSLPTRIPLGFVLPALPTPTRTPPAGKEWFYEIKHDGYRLIDRRDGTRLRLWTRRGYDWRDRYPRTAEALSSLRVRSITIDGEAVWTGKDGRTDFDRLHSHAYDHQVFLYAFDLLELNSEDYRQHPLEKRKSKLEKLLACGRLKGIPRWHGMLVTDFSWGHYPQDPHLIVLKRCAALPFFIRCRSSKPPPIVAAD